MAERPDNADAAVKGIPLLAPGADAVLKRGGAGGPLTARRALPGCSVMTGNTRTGGMRA
jgi:hypothetical protein